MKKPVRRHSFSVFISIGGILLLSGIGMLTQPFVVSRPSTPPPVDALRLETHVRMLSETFYPRSFDQTDKLEAAAVYIEHELRQTSSRVEQQPFEMKGHTYRNVIAHFGPANRPVLVIGAHYDSHGNTAEGKKHDKGYAPDTHTPGADDNASGVAGLLELARLFKANPPAIGVDLVAYTLEEPPFFRTEMMGSAVHARALRASNRAVRGMISLEMIGYFDTTPGTQHYPFSPLGWIYPNRGDFIAVVGSLSDGALVRQVKGAMRGATDLPVHSINAPAQVPGIDFSDHRNYWQEGFSAVMIADTSFYRNTQYHQAGDIADHLDYQRMAKVVQGVYEVVRRMEKDR